jgi:hypothetical protein
MRTATLLLASSLCLATTANAATPCDGIWQKPLAQGQALLKKAAPQIKGLPSKPKVFEVMQMAGWSLIWAEFSDSEPGGYFLHGDRYITVWGGVAAGDPEKEIAAWAIKEAKGVPQPLARCFGWYVVTGREQGPPTRPNPFNR